MNNYFYRFAITGSQDAVLCVLTHTISQAQTQADAHTYTNLFSSTNLSIADIILFIQ